MPPSSPSAKGNYEVAESILRAAAERGHPNSQCMLGLLYELGRGVPKDLQLALEWYHKAAAQDYADAQVSIGRCYDRGVGVPQDYGQAVLWFRKAANAGFADGQFELGQMYEVGTGAPQDYKQSSTGTARLPPKDSTSPSTSLGALT